MVCQKRVALDVVYERLKTKSLHTFAALVHDVKNDRKELFTQIAEQIDQLELFKKENSSLDSLVLEREYVQVCQQIDQLSEQLEDFRSALYLTSPFGISAKELYLNLNTQQRNQDIQPLALTLHYDRLHLLLQRARHYWTYRALLEGSPWAMRRSFHLWSRQDLAWMTQLISEIHPAHQAFQDQVQALGLSEARAFDLMKVLEKLRKIALLLQQLQASTLFTHYLSRKTEAESLHKKAEKVYACFEGPGIEKHLHGTQLEEALQLTDKAIKHRSSSISWFFWSRFTGHGKKVVHWLIQNKLSSQELKTLKKRIENRLLLEKYYSQLGKISWLNFSPETLDLQTLKEQFNIHFQALEAKALFQQEDILVAQIPKQAMASEKLSLLLRAIESWATQVHRWEILLVPTQLEALTQSPDHGHLLTKHLEKEIDLLIEMDHMKSSLPLEEEQLFEVFYNQHKEISLTERIESLKEQIYLCWLYALEEKYPVLRSVSTPQMALKEDALQQALKQKEKISAQIVLQRAREHTYKNLEYNRLQNVVSYRDLHHQVSKKRNLWTMRKVFLTFEEDLLRLIPCWLASPESVSALLEMQAYFDLVIFDEASQCFAEEGLPAMFRGTQVVVAGDSQQLRPNDLYKVRFETSEDLHPDLESESLLDLSQRYLESLSLHGHYRSRSLELIAFSNQYFYKNHLLTLPDFHTMQQAGKALSYLKVDGVWKNQCNEPEARAVAERLITLLQTRPEASLGVITFNYKQAERIQDLLEAEALKHQILIPEHLFVKNIENVQGDERDIILFSTGYAPDESGRLHMHFGSLNMEGGQNRLNVAITRAREAIEVISSLLPHQLQVEEAKQEGPRLFKKYLEYVWQQAQGTYIPPLPENASQRPEWYLKSKLSQTLKNASYLPFADIALKGPQGWEKLMLTDDELYLQALSAKEAHGYLPIMLQSKHWPYERHYSRNWWISATSID